MKSLTQLFQSAHSAIIETPDLYLGGHLSDVLHTFLEQKKKLQVLTNPPSRLGRLITSFNGDMSLIKKGALGWRKQSIFSRESEPLIKPENRLTKWTKHNKAVIFNDLHVLLTSFNFNVMSEYFNPESGFLFLDAPELVEYLKSLYRSRPYLNQSCQLWNET